MNRAYQTKYLMEFSLITLSSKVFENSRKPHVTWIVPLRRRRKNSTKTSSTGSVLTSHCRTISPSSTRPSYPRRTKAAETGGPVSRRKRSGSVRQRFSKIRTLTFPEWWTTWWIFSYHSFNDEKIFQNIKWQEITEFDCLIFWNFFLGRIFLLRFGRRWCRSGGGDTFRGGGGRGRRFGPYRVSSWKHGRSHRGWGWKHETSWDACSREGRRRGYAGEYPVGVEQCWKCKLCFLVLKLFHLVNLGNNSLTTIKTFQFWTVIDDLPETKQK